MGKEIVLIGAIGVIIGTFLLIITKFHSAGIIYGVVIIVIGLALIILNKEEDKIEQRKDAPTKGAHRAVINTKHINTKNNKR